MLQFDEVTVHVNLTKTALLDVLKVLKEHANNFDKELGSHFILVVAIINIGFLLDLYDY